jgi:Baseplate J-like protein
MLSANRPGLAAITYRVGTYGSFFESMKARLSGADHPALSALKTRELDDASIALLDAWAVVGDVLSFYQERIANEGYLRTATERRSVLELSKLLGYALRPGVAATVYFAYTLEKDSEPVEVPKGSRAQSIPAPGETAQSFETSEALKAQVEWSELKPRLTRPQNIQSKLDAGIVKLSTDTIYFAGTSTRLNSGDALLFEFAFGDPVLRHVKRVETDQETQRTKVILQEQPYAAAQPVATLSATSGAPGSIAGGKENWEGDYVEQSLQDLFTVIRPLSKPPLPQYLGSAYLPRNASQTFASTSDIHPQLLATFYPLAAETFYLAWGSSAQPSGFLKAVHVLRVKANLFGYNAGKNVTYGAGNAISLPEWKGNGEAAGELNLDAIYQDILPDSWVVIQENNLNPLVERALSVDVRTRSAYGLNSKSTRVKVDASAWPKIKDTDDITALRTTLILAGSEALDLAEEPLDSADIKGQIIELGALYPGLQSGRWIIVSGERSDTSLALGESISGLKVSELAMLSGVLQNSDDALPGDKIHSTLQLSKPLAYAYKRDTVTIFGNVIKATHGETRAETLGGGDAAKSMQRFELRQAPLTYVSASTANGISSTLEVRVNDLLWHESDGLAGMGVRDRAYLTSTDNDAKTSVIFGTGKYGLRPPTGLENIKVVYRNGIGKSGNVKAEQISLLSTKPLGVKAVINPLRASGGADAENRDQARKNAPLAVMALDRLVSLRDYEDFARSFAGVGKTKVTRLVQQHRSLIHLTLAGADDIPIDKTSDLYMNLQAAFLKYGDRNQPIQIDSRELRLLVMSAQVRVLPDYLWDAVAAKIRSTLLDAFGFEKQALAQPIYLSKIIQSIQAVEGVSFVDVDVLDSVPESVSALELTNFSEKLQSGDQPLTRVDALEARVNSKPSFGNVGGVFSNNLRAKSILPAQLSLLSASLPDTLILKELK